MSRTERLMQLDELSDKELVERYKDSIRRFRTHSAAEGHYYFREETAMYSAKDDAELCETLIEKRKIKGIVTIVEQRDYVSDRRIDRTITIEWLDKEGAKISEGGDY